MDSELRSVIYRYSVVGIVLVAAVIWTVAYASPPPAAANGAPVVLTSGVDDGAVPSPRTAGSTAGAACAAACTVEASCGLRDEATCRADSCDGESRKPTRSDALLLAAHGCGDAAASACAEACERKGACDEDPSGVAACTQACRTLTTTAEAPKVYREARCMLEATRCDDVRRCRQ